MLADDQSPTDVHDHPYSAQPPRLHAVAAPPRPTLSAREVEVLLAWLRATSKEEAAQELFISAATVSTHILRIRAKYAAVGRPAKRKAALFARAVQDGYTTLDEW